MYIFSYVGKLLNWCVSFPNLLVDINENDLLDNVTIRNNLLYLGLFKCDVLFLVCPIESNK